jgi:hypothetical protein
MAAGCSEDKPSAPPTTSTPSSPNLAAPSPLAGSTRAGTRLKFGAKAVITIGRADSPRRVGVIITGVNKA